MKIINQWTTEREGNDAWLRYNLSIVQEWDEIKLQLKTNHDGWGGNLKETKSMDLDPHDVNVEMIDHVLEYIDDYSAYDKDGEMVKVVAEAIKNIGFDRGDLWFDLADAVLSRVEEKKLTDL